jgi:hypothetical protein
MHDSLATLDAPIPPAPAAPPTYDAAAPVPPEYDLFCESCGYSLIGLTGDRCPECGQVFDALALPYARVPWLHRGRLGRWKAYWQTVRQVIFRPRGFATELCRPVRISARDARRFRGISIHIAALSAALLVMLTASTASAFRGTGVGEPVLTLLQGGLFVVLWAGAAMFLWLATDMPVFIWEGLPSLPVTELAPLQHYAAAPLALFPFVALFVASWALAWQGNSIGIDVPLGIVAAGAAVAWAALCWRTPLVLMRAATGCGRRRVLQLALYLPLHWFLMSLMSLILTMIILFVSGEIIKRLL